MTTAKTPEGQELTKELSLRTRKRKSAKNPPNHRFALKIGIPFRLNKPPPALGILIGFLQPNWYE